MFSIKVWSGVLVLSITSILQDVGGRKPLCKTAINLLRSLRYLWMGSVVCGTLRRPQLSLQTCQLERLLAVDDLMSSLPQSVAFLPRFLGGILGFSFLARFPVSCLKVSCGYKCSTRRPHDSSGKGRGENKSIVDGEGRDL